MPFNPLDVLDNLNLDEGDVVADLGCGTGKYALEAARRLKDVGRVYAVDVNKNLLNRVKNEAEEEGLENIHTIWGDLEYPNGSGIEAEVCDYVIVSNILFQIEDKQAFLGEIERILKRSGAVLVVDWSESFGGLGPQSGAVVSDAQAKELFKEKGFEIINNITVGPHHYGFLARPKT